CMYCTGSKKGREKRCYQQSKFHKNLKVLILSNYRIYPYCEPIHRASVCNLHRIIRYQAILDDCLQARARHLLDSFTQAALLRVGLCLEGHCEPVKAAILGARADLAGDCPPSFFLSAGRGAHYFREHYECTYSSAICA